MNIPEKNARVYWYEWEIEKGFASTVFLPEKNPKGGEEDKYFQMA